MLVHVDILPAHLSPARNNYLHSLAHILKSVDCWLYSLLSLRKLGIVRIISSRARIIGLELHQPLVGKFVLTG